MDYTGCKHLALTQTAAAIELLNRQDSMFPRNTLFSQGTSLRKHKFEDKIVKNQMTTTS